MLSLLLSLLLVPAGPAVHADPCDFEDTRTASLAGARTVSIEAHAGSLRVEGRTDATSVRVEAKLCASSRDLLAAMRLETGVNDGQADIVTVLPDRMFDRGYARIDLVVVVPQGMAAHIVDGSGELWLSGLGDTRVVDGSGDASIAGIRGALDVEDGSGSLTIRDVSGDVTIDDGSGGIEIADVQGGVRIDDGSGEIAITGVRRSVVIDDSSGGIRVDRIGGDFTVTNDGSGGIRHSNVSGTVRVPPGRRRGR